MSEYHDHPLDELIPTMLDAMLRGGRAYLKFTCTGCGARQTIQEPNTLYAMGQCEECGEITDIDKQGGNLTVILPV